MNIQQLEYIIAVDEHRHFQKAAQACFVTPATLSMMIKKLEQELNVVIFDRSKKTVIPTDIGEKIIEKARTALHHLKEIKHVAEFATDEIAGEVKIGIIPTLSPYLSHLFLPHLMHQFPNLKIKLYEWNTNQILDGLQHNRIDIGLAATPLKNKNIREIPVFYEKLVAYTSSFYETDQSKEYIVPQDINIDKLWLLEEEHCLRSQVINLCSLKKMNEDKLPLDFEVGSIETLLNIVNLNHGITIIPELVIPTLTPERAARIKHFNNPAPVREISLLTYRHFIKEKLIDVLHKHILEAVQPYISSNRSEKRIIDI